MFAAKVEPVSEMRPIVWIVLFGVLSFLAIVGYFYYQLNVVNAPATTIPNPPALPSSASQQPPITAQGQLSQAPSQDAASAGQLTPTVSATSGNADNPVETLIAQPADNTNEKVMQAPVTAQSTPQQNNHRFSCSSYRGAKAYIDIGCADHSVPKRVDTSVKKSVVTSRQPCVNECIQRLLGRK